MSEDMPLSEAPAEDLYVLQRALAEKRFRAAPTQRVALQLLGEVLRLRAVVDEYEGIVKQLRRKLRKKREARR